MNSFGGRVLDSIPLEAHDGLTYGQGVGPSARLPARSIARFGFHPWLSP